MLLAAIAFAALVLLGRSLGPLVRFLLREKSADAAHAREQSRPLRISGVYVIRGNVGEREVG